jgi:lipid A 3-O-deacylase
MFRSLLATTFFLSCLAVGKTQDSMRMFKRELTLITENDNYNFTKKDRYYSNGIFLRYQWLSRTVDSTKPIIKIHRAEAGQLIYNPSLNRRSLEQVLAQQDRPYAAWLYAGYGQTNVFTNNRIVQFDVMLGVLGPAAKGEEVQTTYHKTIGLYKLYGWENQVQNEVGLNASVQYYHPLGSSTKNVSVHAAAKATLGNTFTNASMGLLLKLGRLEQEQYSSYWTGRLGQQQKQERFKTEFIYFLEPMLQIQAYNATVQGGLFRSNKGSYTTSLNPFLYQIKTGIVVARRTTSFSAYYNFRQREAKSMIAPLEVYGGFALSFRFR